MSDTEKIDFSKYFQDTYMVFPYTAIELMGEDDKQSTSLLPKMLRLFHQSFSVIDTSTAALLRTIVIEMLIDGNAELNYRLKRSLAVLLGEDIEDAVKIEKAVHKIYTARSKFVHDGQRIEKEVAELILTIVCKYLKKLYSIKDDIKTIRNKLHQGKYGEPPY